MGSDVVRNKIEIIERCLARVRVVYASTPSNLNDFTKQDSIVLNLQRAVEASIDIAMFVVSAEKLGLPQSSRHSFEMLHGSKFISETLLTKMSAMVGFCDIVVHNYQKISLPILQAIIEHHLGDFYEFIQAIKRWA